MKEERLMPPQVMTLTACGILGIDILIVQRDMVGVAGQDAWISLILGGMTAMILGSVCYYLAHLYPEMDLPQILLHIFGDFFGRIILLPFIVYDVLYLGMSLRIFAQALKMFLLSATPMLPIVVLILLAAGYAVCKGVFAIGGIMDIIFPLCAVTILGILLMPMNQIHLSNLKPILYKNTGNVVKGILTGYQQFTGYGTIAYFYCYTQKTKGTFKWYLAGLGIPIFLYIALTLITIMVFGPTDIGYLTYPTLTLAKSIEIPGTFLERAESFAAILWINIVFVSVALLLFRTKRNFLELLHMKTKHQNYVIWGIALLLIGIALFIRSGTEAISFFSKIKKSSRIFGLLIFPFITAMGYIKKRRETRA